MLIARAYTVMDRYVVEVSCVHPGDAVTSHLVIREERGPLPPGQTEALRALAEVADMAAWLTEAARAGAPSGTVQECEIWRVSPSC